MAILNKSQILAARDLKIEKLAIPEWGEGAEVCIRSLNASERDKFEASLVDLTGALPKPKIDAYRARLCALVICDEEGNRLFTDSEIAELGKKNGEVLDRIATAASLLSNLNEEALKEAAKKLKNSPPADLPTA